MRKFTFKSLLITAALCLGTSALAQTTTEIDPVGTTQIHAGEADVAKYDANATSWTCTISSISGGSLKNSGNPSYAVITKFDAAAELEGKVLVSATLKFHSVCTVSGKSSRIDVASISTAWDVATATWNNTNPSISASYCGTSGSNIGTGGGDVSIDVTELLSNSSDGMLGFAIYTYTGREQSISDIKLEIVAADASTTKTYTINYKYNNETVKTETGESPIGVSVETVTVITTDGGDRYLSVEDAQQLTITADGTNTWDVEVRKPYTATLSVTTTIGNETSEPVVTSLTETDDKVCSWSYAYSKYVEKDGEYYVADDVTSFVKTGTFTDGEQVSKTIVYTKEEGIVYFGEWEDNAVKTGGTFNNVAYNNFSNGRGYSLQQSAKPIMSVTFSVAEDGIYSIEMPYYNNNDKSRGHSIQLDGVELENKSIDKYTGGTFTIEQFLAAGEHTMGVQITYSLTSAFDYLLVKKVADANITTTITAAGYATFSSTYAVDFSKAEGLAAYTAKVNDGNQTITLTKITDGIVPANTGVVLKGAAGEYTGTITTTDATYAENALVANSTEVTGNGTIYVLNKVDENVGFYPLATGATLAAGKAYLQLTSGAKGYTFVWNDGETTGIEENYEFGTMNSDAATFDLSGRKVANPAKGLYIKNGKKFIVK
ncbi:MAG: hypothetical protein J6A02_10560 [Prevotella sp.]|nr:hypothetical protein [Prevotella sp.]